MCFNNAKSANNGPGSDNNGEFPQFAHDAELTVSVVQNHFAKAMLFKRLTVTTMGEDLRTFVRLFAGTDVHVSYKFTRGYVNDETFHKLRNINPSKQVWKSKFTDI